MIDALWTYDLAAPRVLLSEGAGLLLLAGAAWTDARRGIIPNRLVGAALPVGALLQVIVGGTQALVGHVAAGLAVAVVLGGFRVLGRWLVGQPGFGMGDVKLGGALGLFFGWKSFALLYLGCVAASVVGGALQASGRLERGHRLPFGPFLLAGGLLLPVALPLMQKALLW